MKKFKITQEQIEILSEYTPLVRDWFPEAFKNELEVVKWATIIETITKKEAEKILNKKIV